MPYLKEYFLFYYQELDEKIDISVMSVWIEALKDFDFLLRCQSNSQQEKE